MKRISYRFVNGNLLIMGESEKSVFKGRKVVRDRAEIGSKSGKGGG